MAMNGKLLRPRQSGFTPRSVANLAAWYDAADASSITMQTGVQQWADKSGNARHLIQNTTNNQPAMGSVTLNGKAAITFDGANDFIRAAYSISQPYIVFAVWRLEATPTSTVRIMDGRAGSGVRAGEVFTAIPYNAISLFSGAQLVGGNAGLSALTTFNIWDFTFNGSASSCRLRTTASVSTGNAGTNSPSGLTLGANGNATAAEWANVSFAEVCIYSRELSTAEAASVRRYLGTKWNLAYLS